MLHKSENRRGGVGMRSWPAEPWRCSVSAKAQLQPLSMSLPRSPHPEEKFVCTGAYPDCGKCPIVLRNGPASLALGSRESA